MLRTATKLPAQAKSCAATLQEKEDNGEKHGVKYHRVERSSGFVKRSIRMPDSADLSQIKVRTCCPRAACYCDLGLACLLASMQPKGCITPPIICCITSELPACA